MSSTNKIQLPVPVKQDFFEGEARFVEARFVTEMRDFYVEDLKSQTDLQAVLEGFGKVMQAYFLNGVDPEDRAIRVRKVTDAIKDAQSKLEAVCPPCPYHGECRDGVCDYTRS